MVRQTNVLLLPNLPVVVSLPDPTELCFDDLREFRIWAYPLILTPGVTSYETDGQARNSVFVGKGMLFIGEGGARMLDMINSYWIEWRARGKQPIDIGYAKSQLMGASVCFYSKTVGNTVWSRSP